MHLNKREVGTLPTFQHYQQAFHLSLLRKMGKKEKKNLKKKKKPWKTFENQREPDNEIFLKSNKNRKETRQRKAWVVELLK